MLGALITSMGTGMHTTTTAAGKLSGTAHGITYTGRWRTDPARPVCLAAVVHLAGQQQPLALKLWQLSGRAVDVWAALPALHAMVNRRARDLVRRD